MTLQAISQILLLLTGGAAGILVANKNKWGQILGLLSQPFWFYSNYTTQQYGALVLVIFYTFVWMWGIYIWFYKKRD